MTLRVLCLGALVVAALGNALAATRATQASQQFPDLANLPRCQAGANKGKKVPPLPVLDPMVPGCVAKPSVVMPHPLGKRQPPPNPGGGNPGFLRAAVLTNFDLQSTFRRVSNTNRSGYFRRTVPTTGYHFVNSTTNNSNYTTNYGTLEVNDPDLTGTGTTAGFAAAWFMLHDGDYFNQVGWAENTWTGYSNSSRLHFLHKRQPVEVLRRLRSRRWRKILFPSRCRQAQSLLLDDHDLVE